MKLVLCVDKVEGIVVRVDNGLLVEFGLAVVGGCHCQLFEG